ncbi:MAG: CheR family methyltransferase [Thermodesulfobacteriota bacterium]
MAFTYFFRDLHTLENVVRQMVPEVLGRSRIRVWDAGCAMGQEPYSLAMLFAENLGKFAFGNLQIQATDVDESNLFESIINTGEYPEDQVKRIPRDIFNKYFQPGQTSGYFRLVKGITSRVVFQRHDLLSLQPVGGNFSLVLCKNVLLHFPAPARVAVIKLFHQTLAPGGFFATEQTQKLPGEVAHLFQQVAGDAQLFRKVEDPGCN